MLNYMPVMVWIEFLFIIIPAMLSAGFFTLMERKIMGSIQMREGPTKVIVKGFTQPITDAVKLFSKTNFSPEVSMDFIYFMSPLISFFVSLMCWITFPLSWSLFSWYSSILFIMFCFSVSVYGTMFSGWFSRSKYAILGCIRALSQSISYEIPLSTCMIMFMVIFSSFSMKEISNLQFFVIFLLPFILIYSILMIIFLAEMNRAPFDLAEGESELVSGFSVELGSSTFILVFLSEYLSLVWVSLMMSIMFIGPMNLSISIKIIILLFLMVWIRSTFPRIRYDQVMILCWIILLPLSLSMTTMFIETNFNQSQMSGMLLLMMLLMDSIWLLL